VAEEEAEHFAGCVGPGRVRVRAVRAAAGPSVTAAVNDRLLHSCSLQVGICFGTRRGESVAGDPTPMWSSRISGPGAAVARQIVLEKWGPENPV
jgi:hypothetical protein